MAVSREGGMTRRALSLCGVLTVAAALMLGGAGAAQAKTQAQTQDRAGIQGCITWFDENYGRALCGNGPGSSFSVGVQCLKPGNVYYWNRSRWYSYSGVPRFAYCNSGHVATGMNVWFTS